MESKEEKKVEKTWKPTTAGILALISGIIGCIYALVVTVEAGMPSEGHFSVSYIHADEIAKPVVLLVLGIVAIVGSVYAWRRKSWGLALAGSICALSPVGVLGILAIIFVALGKGEFK